MATDQSSTVMKTATVRPYIVNAQISDKSAVLSIARVRVANRIGKTRFAREKQEMEEKLGKLILTNEKNKEENIASSSVSAAKEEGLDKEEQRSAKVEGSRQRRQRRAAVPQWRQEVGLRQDLIAVRLRRERRKSEIQAKIESLNAAHERLKAVRLRREADLQRRRAAGLPYF